MRYIILVCKVRFQVKYGENSGTEFSLYTGSEAEWLRIVSWISKRVILLFVIHGIGHNILESGSAYELFSEKQMSGLNDVKPWFCMMTASN